MDEKIISASDCGRCTENVCINASQIYDSCRAKECLENLRVYFTAEGQSTIENACKVTATCAEVIWIYSDVEPLCFHRGYYTVNLKFFFRVELSAYTGLRKPESVEGLAYYEKKIVLFGSEGVAKIFQSKYKEDSFDIATWKKTNMPNAVAEVVDPIVLNTITLAAGETLPGYDFDIGCIPDCVHRLFDSTLINAEGGKQVYVTLGLFLLVRLEREVQLTLPAAYFSIPDSTCRSGETPGNPCEMFDGLSFPIDEFFPPQLSDFEPDSETNCDCD